jgi:hypothetical protein
VGKDIQMSNNHPSRNVRYAYVSPRGFANEFTVYSVAASDKIAVGHLQALIDRHDADNGGDSYWLASRPRGFVMPFECDEFGAVRQ